MISISLLNNISVGIFGMVLSAAFCDIRWTKQKHLLMIVSMAGVFLIQGIVNFSMDTEVVRQWYPMITHLPLVLTLYVLTKKIFWSTISVLTAYLCCFLRRWLALLIVAIVPGEFMKQCAVELVVTFPLLLLLVRFVAPAVRTISAETLSVQGQFGLIPALSYLFDYMTQVYTDWFSTGDPVVAEFMSFVCSGAYLVFVIRTTEEKRRRNQLEQTQSNLSLQVAQAVREIELLRKSQEKARIYRHDLRHHMQYLTSCIENGRYAQAQEYMQSVCTEMETNKVITFCENEAANLIFSAFAGRAKEQGISMEIHAELPREVEVSDIDMCVLLSNALENALHACQKQRDGGLSAQIEVSAYEKNKKLFFQIKNSCGADIRFDKGIPVTNNPGHGIGVRSICALIEQYNGIYSFSVKDGQFILRMSL